MIHYYAQNDLYHVTDGINGMPSGIAALVQINTIFTIKAKAVSGVTLVVSNFTLR
jgi:hypothetical protein